MSTASAYLTVRGIDIDVIYGHQELHIGVYPPLGRVRVEHSERLDDDKSDCRHPAIALISASASSSRLHRDRPSARWSRGVPYFGYSQRLKVVERPGHYLETDGDRLVLYTPSDTTAEERRRHSIGGTDSNCASPSPLSSTPGSRS